MGLFLFVHTRTLLFILFSFPGANITFCIIERRYAYGDVRQDFEVAISNICSCCYWRHDRVYFQKFIRPLEKQLGVLTEPLSFLD